MKSRTHTHGCSIFHRALVFLFTLFWLSATPLFAQNREINVEGTVFDNLGEPLPSASVVIKGTTTGVVTDFDGNFRISAPKGATIEVGFVGFKTYEHKVEKQTKLKITLQEDTHELDDVMVIGYGTSTKRSVISSVSKVESDQLAALPVSNISQGLAGRAAGLIVQGSGGGVDKRSTISIRGGGTPLVVIDGIIRNYDDFIALAPTDIEALSVLKDASATAVYGSRASNGIIQVTTKKGQAGKTTIDYSYSSSFAEPATWPERMEVWDRAYYANISAANQGLEPAFSEENIQTMKDGSDPISFSNTNWEKLVLKDFAPMHKHNIQLTGGSETNQFFISLGNIQQESLYKSNNHNFDRTNFRLSNTANLKDIGLKVGATVDGYVEKKTHPNTSTIGSPGSVFQWIRNRSPFSPHVNQHGLPYNATGNIYAELFGDVGYRDENKNIINGNMNAEWQIPGVKGLSVRGAGNYRYYSNSVKAWRKDPAKYNWEADSNPTYDGKPRLNHDTSEGYTYNLQAFLNYNKTFGKHTVSALGGYEATYGFGKSYWLSRENYDFDIDQIGVGPEATQKNGGSESESGRAGWIGQLKYNFDNKYFVEASVRYDGSDNFPKENRWGTFYSASLGWSVIDENFMQPLVDRNILNQLKLRGSFGQVGLDNWDDPFKIGRFEYINSYTLSNTAWVADGAYVPGFSEGKLPSPDITWFTTNQLDLGMDFATLNNRVYGSVDYFYYATKGFLYAPNPKDVGYTDPLGASLPRVSTDGEHRRAGFDFTLGWQDTFGDFSIDVTGNFTKFDQLWAVKPDESLENLMNPYKRQTQQQGYSGIMYHNLGYYESADQIYNSVKRIGSHNLTAGNLMYEDFNGDGKIDGDDQIRLGKSNFPRGNYGINIRMDYKGWFMNVLFQGATRFDMYLTDGQSAQTQELPILYEYQTDYWTPSNRDAKFPHFVPKGHNGSNDYVASDYWLINGAYLRMKDISIGYNFKKALLRNVKWLSSATITLAGQNLFTISEATKYGLDPENASVEHIGYPNERVYSINVNLGFNQ